MQRLSFALLALLMLAACYAPTVARERPYHGSDADLTVTRVVHATVILDFGTTRLLVDPWFSPSPPFGHRETIGIAPGMLPPVRGILVTHRHSDHFDRQMLADRDDREARVVVPRGLGGMIRALGYDDVVEVEAWDQTQVGNVFVTAVPSAHSANEVGFVLNQGDLSAYLAGDTLFDEDQFRAIHGMFPQLEVALLPIGGIRIFGRQLDMKASEAVEAARILAPKRVIPYHYGLTGPYPFIIAERNPERRFARLAKNANLPASVINLSPGESWHYYR